MNTGTRIYIAPVNQKSSEARLSCPVWQCFAAVKKSGSAVTGGLSAPECSVAICVGMNAAQCVF